MLTITTRIEVTAGHLLKGVAGEPCACAVWHAIAEALPHLAGSLAVCGSTIRAGGEHHALPQIAVSRIGDIDSRMPVKPFGFALELPDYLALPPAEVPTR